MVVGNQLAFRFGGNLLPGEDILDGFAGGGGASEGIRAALGRSPDDAWNHNPSAIEMHMANNPGSRHHQADIWEARWRRAYEGRRLGLAWFSPDCRHFSRAKGGAPVSKSVRSLAWVVTSCARQVRPRVIMLENVPEFLTWGPLGADSRPIKARAGETFGRWAGQLRRLGYALEHRILNAADYGTPTSRKRLYMVSRCDGLPIRWPAPTHGPGLALPWRTAAECINWGIPVRSIFDPSRRPLAQATLDRIARGIGDYVFGRKARPFLVNLTHGGRVEDLGQPFRTITGANRGEKALVWPHLVQVSAFLSRHYTGVVGQPLDIPLSTITQIDHHSLAAVSLIKLYGTSTGADLRLPMPGVTSGGQHLGLVYAFLVKYYGTSIGQSLHDPVGTITTRDRYSLVTVRIDGETYAIVDIGMRMLAPRELATAQGFPADYILTGTKSEQVARIGNSVCPPVAEALVRANLVADVAERVEAVA